MNQDKSTLRISPKHVLWSIALLAAFLLSLILWVYFADPFSEILPSFWNENLVYFLILIPAVGAAVAGMLVTGQFQKSEPPYRIWQALTAGLLCWMAGEIVGIINGIIYVDGPVPDFSLVDVLWLLGYFFLGLSLYYQLRMIYGTQKKRGLRLYLGLVALAILIAAGLTTLASAFGFGEGSIWIILFIGILYPVFDLTEGSLAIWLSLLFRRGQWSRPWWGLILFSLADGIDTFYWMGGYEKISTSAQSILDIITLTAYPASYMVAGLALLSNYFVLRYGESSGLLKSARKSGLDVSEK